MPLLSMAELRASLAPGQRLLGLDLGSRTVGVALTDVGLMLASPAPALKRDKLGKMAAALLPFVQANGVGGLVVGLPLSMDGTRGPAAQAATDWARDLSDRLGLPAALWDERLSSAAVNRAMIQEADLTRKKRAQAVDSAAAAWMLQGALDASLAAHPPPGYKGAS